MADPVLDNAADPEQPDHLETESTEDLVAEIARRKECCVVLCLGGDPGNGHSQQFNIFMNPHPANKDMLCAALSIVEAHAKQYEYVETLPTTITAAEEWVGKTYGRSGHASRTVLRIEDDSVIYTSSRVPGRELRMSKDKFARWLATL